MFTLGHMFMFEQHMKIINGFRATIFKTKPNLRRYYNTNPIPLQTLSTHLIHLPSSLVWASASVDHPHRRACVVLLGSLGRGWPKMPQRIVSKLHKLQHVYSHVFINCITTIKFNKSICYVHVEICY